MSEIHKAEILAHKINGSYIKIHQDILAEIDVSQHKPLITSMEHLLAAVER